MNSSQFIPYCGEAPVPGGLTWNFDPALITAFIGIAALYSIGFRKAGVLRQQQQLLFLIGLLIAAAALMSPLCNLSVALFSARVTQHMVLTLVAVPFLFIGRAELALAALFGRCRPPTSGHTNMSLWLGTAAYAIVIWTWHLPGPYEATLQNNAIYWLMHITTIAAAALLWNGLLRPHRDSVGSAVLVGFATVMQMTLLGAVLTLARRPLFGMHENTTWAWGLSPLQDQQLGGLIMWIPAGLLFTGYTLLHFGLWLHRYEKMSGQPEIGGR